MTPHIFVVLQAEFVSQHQWSAHEEALSLCRDHNLNQTLYFLSRDLIFMKEVSANLNEAPSRRIKRLFPCILISNFFFIEGTSADERVAVSSRTDSDISMVFAHMGSKEMGYPSPLPGAV